MKIGKASRLVGLAIAINLILIFIPPVYPQSGNQSDVTGPNPLEFIPDLPRSDLQGIPVDSTSSNLEVDRDTFDNRFSKADFNQAVEQFEQLQAFSYAQQLDLKLFGQTTTPCEIAESLDLLFKQTSKKPALIYTVLLEQQLELLLVVPTARACGKNFDKQNSTHYIRKVITKANRKVIEKIANNLRVQISNPRKVGTQSYMPFARELYELLIAPLEPEINANRIDTLIFSMDKGLRSFPIAALNNGQEFLIEKYAVGVIPSFSLTDTRYRQIKNARMLAFGVSESTQGQTPLPAVAVELPILNELWGGEQFINQAATLTNFESQNSQERFSIIHVATHAEFLPGRIDNSYIQFWNEKLKLDRLRQLSEKSQWSADPKVELLVLSACRTALGDEQAELGFAGLALQAGVKTAIGSLWYVSDRGSLALMSEFYRQLRTAPLKTEALRQAQLAMLKEQVLIKDGQLQLPDRVIPIPEEISGSGLTSLSHPYFWSAFTVIGNWN